MIRWTHAAVAFLAVGTPVFSLVASDSSLAPRRGSNRAKTEPRRRIEIEIGTSGRVSALKMQRWSQRLASLKVQSIRIRQMLPDDEISISEQGEGGRSTVRVFGVLDARGRLIVPGRVFSERDLPGLRKWLDELREYGPKGTPEGKPVWGLSRDQFAALRKSLSEPATAAEKESLALLVERFRAQTQREVSIDADVVPQSKVDPMAVPDDAKGLSWGTWMALVLWQNDLVFRPERTPNDSVRLRVASAELVGNPWPVGWTSSVRRNQLVPKLFEFVTVELGNVTLATVLTELESRIEVPIFVDLPALKQAGIDPDEVRLSLPPKRAAWITNLRKMLFPVKLKSEVRVDEAGKPFLWVTTLKAARRASVTHSRSQKDRAP